MMIRFWYPRGGDWSCWPGSRPRAAIVQPEEPQSIEEGPPGWPRSVQDGVDILHVAVDPTTLDRQHHPDGRDWHPELSRETPDLEIFAEHHIRHPIRSKSESNSAATASNSAWFDCSG